MITDIVMDGDTMGGMMNMIGGVLVAINGDIAEAEVLLWDAKNLHAGRTVLKEEQK
jgi:hypothetical protein